MPCTLLKKNIFTVILCVIILLSGSAAQATNTVTLTTYYPAPNGEYTDLTVSNNFGIGTTSPAYPLDVWPITATVRLGNALIGKWPYDPDYALFGNSNLTHSVVGNYALLQKKDGDTYLNARPGHSISFCINDVPGMTLTSTGNIGIGTTTTNSIFEVNDHIKFMQTAKNTFVGYQVGKNILNGSENSAFGYNALYSNRNGIKNSAFGYKSLYANINSDNNTAFGSESLGASTSGSCNTAVGSKSLPDNLSGDYNVAVGTNALIYNKTGSYNVGIGNIASPQSSYPGLSNAIAIGNGATTSESDSIVLGNTNILKVYCAVTGLSAISDGRFKNNVTENVPGLVFITKLRPITFHWDMDKLNTFLHIPEDQRSRESEHTKSLIQESGFIAQEVEQAVNAVGYDFNGLNKPNNDNDYYSLSYTSFVVPLVKAVQELNTQMIQQQEELDKLRPMVKKMKQQINQLATQLNRLENSRF